MHWWVPEGPRKVILKVLRKSNKKLFSYASRRNSLPRVILGKVKFGFSLSSLLSMFFDAVVCVACFSFFCMSSKHAQRVHTEEKTKGNGYFSLRVPNAY